LNSWNAQTVQLGEETSRKTGTVIRCAIIMVVTSDVGIHATSAWVATLNGASVIVIAVNRNIIRNMITSSSSITKVVSASIHIITSKSSVST